MNECPLTRRMLRPSIRHRRSAPCTALGLALALAVGLLIGTSEVRAQSRDQVRSEAESRLRGMTPAEIQRKLRELGVSREDAARRAAEYGISLEDYLTEEEQLQADEEKAAEEQDEPKTKKQQKKAKDAETTRRESRATDRRRASAEAALLPGFDLDAFLKGEPFMRKVRPEIPGFSDRKGSDSLDLFGLEIFTYDESTVEPALNMATPASYRLGPGDELELTVWGETKLKLRSTVTREGNLVVPEVGPVSVNGLTITQFRERLIRRMSEVYSGLKNGEPGANTFLDISLGKLRTIQVFVLGEVERPGGYTLSSMSNILHALYAAGGPTVNGSVRDVQAVRDGDMAGTLDVYDHMILGRRGKETRLQDGDVVFVKPAPKRVAIAGRVVRPAIYELKKQETLGDLIALAGGLRFDSYTDRVHVQRVVPFDQRGPERKDFVDFDLAFASAAELKKSPFAMEDGDLVSVMRVGRTAENRITVRGPVKQPGDFELTPGARVRDILAKADSLDRDAFSERGTLYRLLPNLKREVLSFNPRLAMLGDPAHNLALQTEDTLEFYKETEFYPTRMVSIGGAVQRSGTYPRYEGMRVSDLVVLAGGMLPNAKLDAVEIARMDTASVELFGEIISVNMTSEFWRGVDSTDAILRDFDHVLIPYDPRYSSPKTVRVYGFLMLQGDYTLRFQGEKLSDVIERAGGLRAGAYLPGARLFRQEREGRAQIPVDFERALADRNSLENVDIVEGDSIYVPPLDNVVYVKGEVYTPAGVVYRKGASLAYYIQQAGGFTKSAEAGDVAVTLPNGRKWEPSWFIFPDPDILPGSTVSVPEKLETEDNTLPILRDMTTILASLAAITVALIQVTK